MNFIILIVSIFVNDKLISRSICVENYQQQCIEIFAQMY